MKQVRPFVTKWAPVNVIDFRGMEDWLESMAAQGLVYQTQSMWNLLMGGPYNPHFFLVKFRRENPRPGRRYRMIPAPKMASAPSSELRELYEASGWRYVDLIELIYVSYFLFETDDPDAAEPYTDPESFRLAFHYPVWGFLILLAVFAVLGVVFYALSATASWLAEDSALMPQWGVAAAYILLAASSLLALIGFVLDLSAVILLRRSIRRLPTTRPALPKSLFPVQKVLFLATEALIVLAFLSIPLSMIGREDRSHVPLTEFKSDFDLLLLSEMEGDGSWIPSENWSVPSLDVEIHYNAADIRSDPSQEIRTWYSINQTGSGASGSSSLDFDYYIAASSQAAQALLSGLEQGAQFSDQDTILTLPKSLTFQAREVPGADIFQFRREGSQWEVLARRGERALALSYQGALDLSAWFGDIAGMLTALPPDKVPPVQWPSRETTSLSEFDPDFPLLTLEDMEADGSWVPSENITLPAPQPAIRHNYVTTVWNPDHTAPLRHSVDQAGTGTSGDSQLDITYYFSKNAQAAQRQLESLLADRSAFIQADPYDPGSFQEVEVSGAEVFLVHTVGLDPEDNIMPSWEVLARKGDRLLSLRYDGSLDLTEWYGEIAAMLTPET